ncbi:hypothetical protein [Nocardioides pakistanensis]
MGVMTTAFAVASEKVPGAPEPAGGGGGSRDVWLTVAIALLGSSLVAGLITTLLSNLRASATSRRDGYANAVRSLIARVEYPYRVRRRISDDPEVLTELVGRGHDLQEQLAACRTWVNSESRAVGAIFERALAAIDGTVNPSTADAWNQPPITAAAGMNLAGWGPGDQWPHLASLEGAIAYRFGWRRLLPAWLWRRWV